MFDPCIVTISTNHESSNVFYLSQDYHTFNVIYPSGISLYYTNLITRALKFKKPLENVSRGWSLHTEKLCDRKNLTLIVTYI